MIKNINFRLRLKPKCSSYFCKAEIVSLILSQHCMMFSKNINGKKMIMHYCTILPVIAYISLLEKPEISEIDTSGTQFPFISPLTEHYGLSMSKKNLNKLLVLSGTEK